MQAPQIGGYDDIEFHVAAQTYRQGNAVDFWAGPVAKDYNEVYDRHNRVWKISLSLEIENHKSNFNQTGYTIPEAIQTWPRQGECIKWRSNKSGII
ncbi:MAG: hypothetical protein MZU79_02140 [Anaerotruncus sp.]|nr:hypothetical protein [Anaerotruncus sp.]